MQTRAAAERVAAAGINTAPAAVGYAGNGNSCTAGAANHTAAVRHVTVYTAVCCTAL
jgi:hypothetical protein